MNILQEIQYRSRQIILPVLAICLAFYLIYHAVQGDRGFLSYMRLEAKLAEAQTELAVLQAQREHLEHRVDLLKPPDVDQDMLEEAALRVLNYAHPDDVVVLWPEGEKEPN